ncbi:MAG: tetratricopeptide repeat protein, partial [Verrucomicrobiota bacterium]
MAKGNETTEEPVNEEAAAAPEVTIVSEDQDAISKLKEYVLPIALGATLAVVLSASIMGYKSYKEGLRATASDLLAKASTPDKLQEIVDGYPESPSAPVAVLALASDNYHEAKYDDALKYYDQLIAQYPNSMMLPSALLGRAYCYEAMGNFQKGIEEYEAFGNKTPDHYLSTMATFGQA